MSTKATVLVNGKAVTAGLVESKPGVWHSTCPLILNSGDTLEFTHEETDMTEGYEPQDPWAQKPDGVPTLTVAEAYEAVGITQPNEVAPREDALEVPRGEGIDVSRFDARPILEAAHREALDFAAQTATHDDSVEIVVWRGGEALTLTRAFEGHADIAQLVRALGRLHDAAVTMVEDEA